MDWNGTAEEWSAAASTANNSARPNQNKSLLFKQTAAAAATAAQINTIHRRAKLAERRLYPGRPDIDHLWPRAAALFLALIARNHFHLSSSSSYSARYICLYQLLSKRALQANSHELRRRRRRCCCCIPADTRIIAIIWADIQIWQSGIAGEPASGASCATIGRTASSDVGRDASARSRDRSMGNRPRGIAERQPKANPFLTPVVTGQ